MVNSKRVMWACLCALSIPTAMSCLADEHTVSPLGPKLEEAIVCTRFCPSNWDIFLFDVPGGTPRQLTHDPALDYNAVFSPDGSWVVFTSERTGSAELYALNLEGEGEPVRLTYHPAMDDAASFSPDGRRLAFVSTRDGDADIFTMPFLPMDTTAESRAVNLTNRQGGDFNPAFSPDGSKIAFSRQPCMFDDDDWRCMDLELCVMNTDGSGVQPFPRTRVGVPADIYDMGLFQGSPAWSLDGTAVYYYYQYDYYQNPSTEFEEEFTGGPDIRRVTLDGKVDELVVTKGYSPAILPDGRIAFVRPHDDDGPPAYYSGRIFSTAADGSDLREESPVPSRESNRFFAPDFDRNTGRMVCHGAWSSTRTEDDSYSGGQRSFLLNSGVRNVKLSDRTIAIHNISGYFPALTPDGRVLSTLNVRSSRDVGTGRFEKLTVPLSVSTIDGTEMEKVFSPPAGIAWGAHMAGDAGWIVVAVGTTFGANDANVDIWKVRLDGSDAINLTPGGGNDALPTISSDGNHIVFRSPRGDEPDAPDLSPGGGEMAIFIMDGNGESRHRLTKGTARETMPAISPDGQWVAYVVLGRNDVSKIWLSRTDGSEQRLLEPARAEISEMSMHPRFSPDGKWVVFTSDRSGLNDERPLIPQPQPYGELYAVPVAGGPAVRLTQDKWEDGPSDWGYVRLPYSKQ